MCTISFSQSTVTLKSGKVFTGKIISIEDSTLLLHDKESGEKLKINIDVIDTYTVNGETVKATNLERNTVTKSGEVLITTAGDELIKASSLYYSGMTLEVIGVASVIIGNIVFKDSEGDDWDKLNSKKNSRNAFTYAGGALCVVGIITSASGFKHIKIAGQKLNLVSTGNSLGLALKF